jgi:hypothetical protein
MDARPMQPVDFELESTSGTNRSLRQYRGKVVIVFYEARDRVDDNAGLKRSLGRFGASTLAGDVVVLGVGDVQAFDFAPARSIARSAIRAIASHYDLEILLDWKGTLARPPFSLDPAKSNVVVVDRSGAITYRYTGVVGPEEERRFISAVSGSLGLGDQPRG